ncbi:uncharacterized protein LOC134528191 [Bacillus rossius redtenbacheri]|uniref:uncharacterized protein LOC134528191 n=1 Tax=Bacillus rossius redtenbacheri TaxID=93214 RepID=UPI002FDE5922
MATSDEDTDLSLDGDLKDESDAEEREVAEGGGDDGKKADGPGTDLPPAEGDQQEPAEDEGDGEPTDEEFPETSDDEGPDAAGDDAAAAEVAASASTSIFQEWTPEQVALYGKECRICKKGDESMRLFRFCLCQHVMHKACLEQSLMDTDHDHCEECGIMYLLKRKPRFTIPQGLSMWMAFRANKAMLAMIAMYAVLVTPIAAVYMVGLATSIFGGLDIDSVVGPRELWLHQMSEPHVPAWLLLVTLMMVGGCAGSVAVLLHYVWHDFKRWYGTTPVVIVVEAPDHMIDINPHPLHSKPEDPAAADSHSPGDKTHPQSPEDKSAAGPPSTPDKSAAGPPSTPDKSAAGPPSTPDKSAAGPPSTPDKSAARPPSTPDKSAARPPSTPDKSAARPPSTPDKSVARPPSTPDKSAARPPSTRDKSAAQANAPPNQSLLDKPTTESMVDEALADKKKK